MELGDKEIEKLQKYLSNEMNASEIEAFKQEIGVSDRLKEFLTIYRQIDSFNNDEEWILYKGEKYRIKEVLSLFQKKETRDFSEKIKNFQKQNIVQKPQKQISWLRFAIGTGIAACLGLVFYFSFFQSPTLNQLYVENSNWNDLPSFTVKGDALEKQKVVLEQLFKEKKYKKTIALSTEIINTSKVMEPNILLYRGISFLEINKFEDALLTFNQLISHKNLIDFHKGYWYKALTYLKMENKEEAKKTLEYISTHKDFYNVEKAIKILEKLNYF